MTRCGSWAGPSRPRPSTSAIRLMVAKHIRSAILSELLLRSTKPGADRGTGQGASSKVLFPTFIRIYLLDEDNHFRESPTSTAPLGALLAEIKESLADRLVTLFAQHWPEEAAELADRAGHRAGHRRDGRRTGCRSSSGCIAA